MNKKTGFLALLIFVLILAAGLMYVFYTPGKIEVPEKPNPIAEVKTSYGDFSIVLYEDKVSPLTDHFIKYAASDFYDGLIFHMLRVSTKELPNGTLVPYEGNMEMTGAYDPNFIKKNPTFMLDWNKRTDVVAGLKHSDLAVSWIHDSYGKIGARWYICNGDFSGRAFQMDSQDPVFGKVISGEKVIRKIGSLPVYRVNDTDPQLSHVPMGANNTTVQIINIHVYRPKSENFDSVLKQEFAEKESISNRSFFLRCSSLVRPVITISNNVGRTSV